MSLLSDTEIRELSLRNQMIVPFEEQTKRFGLISYGLSSYGYDCKLSDEFMLCNNLNSAIIDPKAFDPRGFVKLKQDVLVIPPNSFVLGQTVETFKIPRDVLVICLGKSTYARCGLIVNVTPLEPEWCGRITLEISNTTPLPAKVYANEGIAQLLFMKSEQVCETSYSDRSGKYMNQTEVTPPRVE